MPSKKDCSYCGYQQKYTSEYNSCSYFVEEMFEAKPDSVSTPELSLDLDIKADVTGNKID